MSLIVVVESLSFLFSICRKEGCIKVKQHEFRPADGIHFPPEFPHNQVKLSERSFIHAVKEPWDRGLWCKCLFSEQGRQYGILAQFIGTVVLIVCAEDLVDHLQEILVIRMDTEHGCIVGLEAVLQQLLEAKGMEKFLYHQEPSVGGEFASVKVYDKLLIAFELDFLYTVHRASPLLYVWSSA